MDEITQAQQEIRSKMVMLITAALIFSGVVLGATLIMSTVKSHEDQLRERGLQMVRHIAQESSAALTSEPADPVTAAAHAETLKKVTSYMRQEKGIAYLLILNKNGKVLAEVNASEAEAMLGSAGLPPTVMAGDAVASKKEYDAETFLDLVAPIGNEAGWVRMGLSLAEVSEQGRSLFSKMLLLLTLLTGVGVWGTLLFTKTILAPIEKMKEMAYRISRGDLSGGDGSSPILANFRAMMQRIHDHVGQVGLSMEGLTETVQTAKEGIGHQLQISKKTSSSIETMNASFLKVLARVEELSLTAQTSSPALIEMSAATAQVADSTSNLASYVEDTASALLEMSSSIKQVVEHINSLTNNMSDTTVSFSRMNTSINEIENNAKESALLTEKVSQDADELGRGAIEKTIEGMDNIKKAVERSSSVIFKLGERTEYIGKILTVIDEVTRQTNLLALNAAILAAQAGEHGRGFAVVADEIKSLADRTASSTKEIAQLIRDLQSEAKDAVAAIREGTQSVEEGVRLSLDARNYLNTILEGANRSSSMSRQIEKATLAQVQGIHLVTQSMEKMNAMVHQVNGAMQEQGKVIEHITEGSEKMRLITRQVKSAIEEQAIGSKQTASAIEEVTSGMQQVGQGMSNQKKESQALTKWVADFSEATETHKKVFDRMNQSVEDLLKKIQTLKTEVGNFKV